MNPDEKQTEFVALATMMASIVAHFLVHREMPAPYLDAVAQRINSLLQEMDIEEVEEDV